MQSQLVANSTEGEKVGNTGVARQVEVADIVSLDAVCETPSSPADKENRSRVNAGQLDLESPMAKEQGLEEVVGTGQPVCIPSTVEFSVNKYKGSASQGVKNNNSEVCNVVKGKEGCRNHGTQQNPFAILSDATQGECEEEINQTPYTRGRGRPRGTTKDKNAGLPGSPARNTRGRKKQDQNPRNLESQKDTCMGNYYVSNTKKEKANLNNNNEAPEVVAKDDPDVIAVQELTYEFVVAVSKRNGKHPWSREEFEEEIVRLKEEGATMVKIY